MAALWRATRRGSTLGSHEINLKNAANGRTARRGLQTQHWGAVLGTRTTMPGACSPCHGAAVCASPLLPNLYGGLGDESLPRCAAFSRRLFFRSRLAASNAPVVANRSRAHPEAVVDGRLAASLVDAMLGRDARVEQALLEDWRRKARCAPQQAERAYRGALDALDESRGFWAGAPGKTPPLAVGLVLARVWLAAADKRGVFDFAEAARNARPGEFDDDALPRVDDVPRWWTGLQFDAAQHGALLDLPASAFARADATRLRSEAAAAACLRYRWQGVSTADARRSQRVAPPPLPAPASLACSGAAPGSPPRPDAVERALREVVGALCWDGRRFSPDWAPALASAPARVRDWFEDYNDVAVSRDLANQDWFDLCSSLGGNVQYCVVYDSDVEYQLRSTRSNFMAALARALGLESPASLHSDPAVVAPRGGGPRLDLELAGNERVTARVLGPNGGVRCQVEVRPRRAVVERSLCRTVDDFAEAARVPPWAKRLELVSNRDADVVADAWTKADAPGAWPLLLACSPQNVLSRFCDREFRGVSDDATLLDGLLLGATPPGRAGSLARARAAERALDRGGRACVAVVARLARDEAAAHGRQRAPTDWRDRVAEAVFSSRALRRPDTKQGAARLLEGPLEFLHSKDAASIAARHDDIGWLQRLKDGGRAAALLARDARSGLSPLAHAARFDAANATRFLLDVAAAADPAARGDPPPEPLLFASQAGALKAAYLLLLRGADANAADDRGVAPLHLAKSVELANLLLQHGADPKRRNRRGHTPLDVLPPHIVRYLKFPRNDKAAAA